MLWGKPFLPFPPFQSFALSHGDCDAIPSHCKPDTGQDGWGCLRESCSKSLSPVFHSGNTHNRISCLPTHATETFRVSVSNERGGRNSPFKSVNWNWGPPVFLKQVTGLVLQCGDTGPHQEVGSSYSGSCFSKHPDHWTKTKKPQLGRQGHLIPEPLLDSSFTTLLIFSNQWEKLTSWTWKLSQFYPIVPSFCSETLTLHFPELKCFISSHRQLFI